MYLLILYNSHVLELNVNFLIIFIQNLFLALFGDIPVEPILQHVVELFLDWQWTDYLSKDVSADLMEELEGLKAGGVAVGQAVPNLSLVSSRYTRELCTRIGVAVGSLRHSCMDGHTSLLLYSSTEALLWLTFLVKALIFSSSSSTNSKTRQFSRRKREPLSQQ